MKEQEVFVGIDVGKQTCAACAMDVKGIILKECKFPNTRADINQLIDGLLSRYGICRALCESTARMWIKTYEEFNKRGIPIILGNPCRLRLTASGPKTDRLDARRLANKLRVNDVPDRCHVYGPEARRMMDILRQRTILVRERTRYLNRQHSICEKYDYPVRTGSATSGGKHQSYLDGLKLGPGDMVLMSQYVRIVRNINSEVDLLERIVARAAYENHYAKLIMTMYGFDAFGALTVAVAVEDIKRFKTPKNLVSFMGLCPRVYQSGKVIKHGRMKKDSDRSLTYVMMNAAMVAKEHDPYLKAYHERHARRHPPLVARSHTANKMAVAIWHMLTDGKPYRYVNKQLYETKLARLKASL